MANKKSEVPVQAFAKLERVTLGAPGALTAEIPADQSAGTAPETDATFKAKTKPDRPLARSAQAA